MPNDKEHVNPKQFIQYMASKMGIRNFDIKDTVVMTFSDRVLNNLIRASKAKLVENWIYSDVLPSYNGRYKEVDFSITSSFIGAPATVMVLEELIACGAKKFVFIGIAGGLRKEASIGTIVIPNEAIREEGTSYHYLPEGINPKPSKKVLTALEASLKEMGIPYLKGKVWSTDAVYREMRSKIEFYSKEGVLAVDMETSAILALAMYRKVEIGTILVISDELFHKKWKPLFISKKVNKSLDKVSRIALEVVPKLHVL